jgi:hypothetical protein
MSKQNELRQADLSHLTVSQMTPAQRAEMRRRFDAFMRDMTGAPPKAEPERPANVRKWVPGMKA